MIPSVSAIGDNHDERLVNCKHFRIRRLTLSESFSLSHDGFQVLMVLSGDVSVVADNQETRLAMGRTALIPFECGRVELHPHDRATVLLASAPV